MFQSQAAAVELFGQIIPRFGQCEQCFFAMLKTASSDLFAEVEYFVVGEPNRPRKKFSLRIVLRKFLPKHDRGLLQDFFDVVPPRHKE